MARLLRAELAGSWYHISDCGNERRAIHRSDCDWRHFSERLGTPPACKTALRNTSA